MTTTIVTSPTGAIARRRRALPTIAIGLFGGLALGVGARAWMRLISDKPEFTWGGTLGIVIGFAVFGFAQSIVAVARTRTTKRWKLTCLRIFGGLFSLQLFVAAGALMFPTVLGAGLAAHRTEWHRVARAAWLLVAVFNTVLVSRQIHDDFGWSLHTLAGIAIMLAIYSVIVWATQFTMARQDDGFRIPRWARLAIALPIGVLIVLRLIEFAMNRTK